jgi:hypothetical protein
MNLRTTVEWLIMSDFSDKEISGMLRDKGYIVTPERIEEMREEMDPSARGLICEDN